VLIILFIFTETNTVQSDGGGGVSGMIACYHLSAVLGDQLSVNAETPS